ncbi:MAG: hypothetical protein R3E66_06880 [bacterium]
MRIIITQWGLDSYLDLRNKNVFSRADYFADIRPAVLLLRDFPTHEKFSQSGFWSPASGIGGVVRDGFKMKWHNIGPGRVQLRLAVAMFEGRAFLCDAYVKSDPKLDKRMMTKLEARLDVIRLDRHIERGEL